MVLLLPTTKYEEPSTEQAPLMRPLQEAGSTVVAVETLPSHATRASTRATPGKHEPAAVQGVGEVELTGAAMAPKVAKAPSAESCAVPMVKSLAGSVAPATRRLETRPCAAA